ncbi:MAG: hypothetical protein V3V22_08495, partial [Methylococcales bacterium]
MSRVIQLFIVGFLVLLPLLSAIAETTQSPISLVSRQDIKLTDFYVEQVFAARKREAQDAIL